MRTLVVCVASLAVAQGGDTWKGATWKPAPQPVQVSQGKMEIMLQDPLPAHWAVSVVTSQASSAATISAGSVVLDGPFIERVDNLDSRRLNLEPGIVRIRGLADESGLAVCLTVPAGTETRVLHEGSLVVDAQANLHKSKMCDSLLVVRQAILAASFLPGQPSR